MRAQWTPDIVTEWPKNTVNYAEETLVAYKMQDSTYWYPILALIILFIFFRVMVVVSLKLQEMNIGISAAGDTRNQ